MLTVCPELSWNTIESATVAALIVFVLCWYPVGTVVRWVSIVVLLALLCAFTLRFEDQRRVSPIDWLGCVVTR